jgi:hypothetical protein
VRDTGPMESMFACPTTGLLFAAYEAAVTVRPAVCVDARTFRCPVCESRLQIGVPGNPPVASCASCKWTTDGSPVATIPDLLSFEGNPFPEARGAFEDLRTQGTRPEEEGPDGGAAGAPLPVRREQCVGEGDGRGIEAFGRRREAEDARLRGFHALSGSVHDSQPPRSPAPVDPRLRGPVSIADVVPLCDRLVPGRWRRACMPARRRMGGEVFTLRSPFTGETVAEGSCEAPLQGADTNAASFMPGVDVRAHPTGTDLIVLSLTNHTSSEVQVDLDVLESMAKPEDESTAPVCASWEDGKSGRLAAGGGVGEFSLRLGAGTGRVDILERATLSCGGGGTASGRRVSASLLDRRWACRLVLMIEEPPITL